MATTITVGGTSITYRDFRIEVPLSDTGVAPTAKLTSNARESITAGDSVVIDIDGTTAFSGSAKSGGTKSSLGALELKAEHDAIELFEETVTFTETSPTDQDVLAAALAASDSGGGFTLTYNGATTSLNNDYEADERTVKRVFSDMADRTGKVLWVNPAANEIIFEPVGNRGLWNSLDATTDKLTVRSFDEGAIDTVRNDVTVIGTGGEQVTGTASDATSISTYGRRTGNSPYNVEYITSTSEASAMASELLVTEPQAEGEIVVGKNVGDVVSPLVNYTVDLTDTPKDIAATGLVVEKQIIEQGRARLQVGQGSGTSVAEFNRSSKSAGDTTKPGSVYDSDRIADGAITDTELFDGSVKEQKLADLAVSLAKVQPDAIDETKIQDNSISTPKLQAESVIASKILADTITANEIDSRTITALEIATDTLTANEIDTLDLDTGQLTVGQDADSFIEFGIETVGATDIPVILPSSDGQGIIGSNAVRWREIYADTFTGGDAQFSGTVPLTLVPDGTTESIFVLERSSEPTIEPEVDNTGLCGNSTRAWQDVWAYNFVDASTGTAINDGGDALAGLAQGHGPPDFVKEKREYEEDGETVTKEGTNISQLTKWLTDICREQQAVIDDLETRLSALEQRISDGSENA